jgi:hypothetical protein
MPYYAERARLGGISGVYFGLASLANPAAPYNACFNWIYKEWKDLAFQDLHPDAWRKVHPGKDPAQALGRIRDTAPVTVREVYRIQLRTDPPPRPPSGR